MGRAVTPRMLSSHQTIGIKAVVWIAALIPFAQMVVGIVHNSLGANPIEAIQRATGWYALVLLCVALAVTPLRQWLAGPRFARLPRLLGLFAVFYAAPHLPTWLWFDHFFDVRELIADVLERPFITIGFIAFALLVPLAATSTHAMVKRLGAKRWQALHRCVYAVAPLAVLHYWWHKAGKNDLIEPAVFAVIVAVLLGARVWWWRRRQTAASSRQTGFERE